MKRFILLIFTAIIINSLSAQPDSLLNKNSVYLELGGSGIMYSIGWEHIFAQKDNVKIGAAIGILYDWVGNSGKIIPQINILFGQKHFFETGIGMIYYKRLDNTLFLPLRIGYRFQKNTQGFYYRAALTPLINTGIEMAGVTKSEGHTSWGVKTHYLLPWAGLSIGYSF